MPFSMVKWIHIHIHMCVVKYSGFATDKIESFFKCLRIYRDPICI